MCVILAVDPVRPQVSLSPLKMACPLMTLKNTFRKKIFFPLCNIFYQSSRLSTGQTCSVYLEHLGFVIKSGAEGGRGMTLDVGDGRGCPLGT